MSTFKKVLEILKEGDQDWLKKAKSMSVAEIKKMSDEEIRQLDYKEWKILIKKVYPNVQFSYDRMDRCEYATDDDSNDLGEWQILGSSKSDGQGSINF